MVDPDEDPEGFQAALAVEREAWRVAATGQPSEVGLLVLRSVAASIAVALPEASSEAQTVAAGKALVVLAQTEWSAATNAMAALFLAGQNKLVAQDMLAHMGMEAKLDQAAAELAEMVGNFSKPHADA